VKLLYCGSGWLTIVDMIASRLPTGMTITRWDRSVPLTASLADIDVLLPSNATLTADVIAAAPRLRLIQQPAAGAENIPLDAAHARGIPVCTAPGTNHIAVAEHALLLLLSLARRAPRAARAFDAREVGAPLGIELAGRTLGIVGMGRSGTALAERARALGMTVHGIGRSATIDERHQLFGACDAISLHCPLDAATRGMIDAAAFAAMRPGALLVNVSRGGVIDRAALVAALATDRLGGVALDVHWIEPPDPADPLYTDPRVVAYPHVAGSTEEAYARITDVIVGNVARLIAGEPLLHRVI
jgi:phosphoglycerate dehydrogenase-like enzyme